MCRRPSPFPMPRDDHAGIARDLLSSFLVRQSHAMVAAMVLLGATVAWAAPIVIAHRSASGYLPEQPLAAAAFAYASGAG